MSKENDEKKRKEREEYLRKKKERWDGLQALQNEKFTIALVNSLTADEFKQLNNNKPGWADYVNKVLFAAPVPPQS